MPKLVGGKVRVVETDHLAIDELTGRVATPTAGRVSVALCTVAAPTGEPWLTLAYDEWMCVLKGVVELHHAEGVVRLGPGETAFIGAGERFRPLFPEADTQYIAVCDPAFSPELCKREDDPDGAVPTTLRALHAKGSAAAAAAAPSADDVLFHMCTKDAWEAAKATGEAYFPATFEADGFTHATAVAARLITTANHFYQGVEGEWVCIRFTRSALKRCGILVKDEEPLPVGDQVHPPKSNQPTDPLQQTQTLQTNPE